MELMYIEIQRCATQKPWRNRGGFRNERPTNESCQKEGSTQQSSIKGQTGSGCQGHAAGGRCPPRLCRAGLERQHGIHDILPCSLRQCRVGVLQIDLGDLQVHGRLPGRLVLGVKEGDGFALVFGAETGLFAGRRFLAIENARSPEQDESLFHN